MEFKSIKERNKYLVENQKEIISLKKASLKTCDPLLNTEPIQSVIKADNDQSRDTDSVIYRTIIGNTYNWLDSHSDVHLDNCFATSIKDKGASRMSHLHDHIHQITAKVGKFEKVYEDMINWIDLGISKSGATQALFADSAIQKGLNEQVFNLYRSSEIDQHSVGMRYSKVKFALNDPEYPSEYAEWNRVYPLLGNPEKADDLGYFYTVHEAILIEISCVLNGSNELTPTIPVKIGNPSNDSSHKEETLNPLQSSKEIKSNFYNLIH